MCTATSNSAGWPLNVSMYYIYIYILKQMQNSAQSQFLGLLQSIEQGYHIEQNRSFEVAFIYTFSTYKVPKSIDEYTYKVLKKTFHIQPPWAVLMRSKGLWGTVDLKSNVCNATGVPHAGRPSVCIG